MFYFEFWRIECSILSSAGRTPPSDAGRSTRRTSVGRQLRSAQADAGVDRHVRGGQPEAGAVGPTGGRGPGPIRTSCPLVRFQTCLGLAANGYMVGRTLSFPLTSFLLTKCSELDVLPIATCQCVVLVAPTWRREGVHYFFHAGAFIHSITKTRRHISLRNFISLSWLQRAVRVLMG